MKSNLIEPKEALEIILKQTALLPTETKPFWQALNQILATDIVSKENIPPFNNSAMDGYAVLAADTALASQQNPAVLKLIAEQPAGKSTTVKVSPGTAIKIMTGAPVPAGADCVAPIEYCEEKNGQVRIFKAFKYWDNIRNAGEDITKGKVVLHQGHLLQPVDIGILASIGQTTVQVMKKPTVAIIGTGDELVDVASPLAPGKIRDSNSYMLYAQSLNCGAKPERLGIAKDNYHAVKQKVSESLNFDVIITSGGVSVGEYDFVKAVLEDLGAQLHFWGVRQKPGKPLAFWSLNNKLIFGLPGNPVASLICFEEYVRPALLKMSGFKNIFRPIIEARLTHPLKRKAGRQSFVGVKVVKETSGYLATVNGPQGSGILTSLSGVNGLAIIPKEVSELKKDAVVKVQLISEANIDVTKV